MGPGERPVSDLILWDQYLPANTGFHFVSVKDVVRPQLLITDSNRYCEVRKWCKEYSTGTYCYTASPETRWVERKEWYNSSGRVPAISYFGFADEYDLTALRLALGNEGMTMSPMYPTNTKFVVLIRGLSEQAILDYKNAGCLNK